MYSGQTLSLQPIDDGFVELCFDNQKESVNKFDMQTVGELKTALDALEKASGVKGLLVTSNKPVFVVGADIMEFVPVFKLPRKEKEKFMVGNIENLNRLEDLPFPTVVAINGFALGGGFEVCLACDFRIMSSKAAVGLPETSLGIIPGWGGTVRLPRLAGFDTAVEWIATGAQQKPPVALKDKAVDAIAEPDKLRGAALSMLQQAATGKLDYLSRRVQKTSPMRLNDIELGMSVVSCKAQVFARAGKNFPAPMKAVDVLASAAKLDRTGALAAELAGFIDLTETSQARAMVGVFLADQYLNKAAKGHTRILKETGVKAKTAAVIGAGIMGGGIAFQNAIKGYPVLMKDINDKALDLGMSEAGGLLAKRVERGKMSGKDSMAALARIHPTLSNEGIDKVDVIVEAVVELEKVKKSVLSDLESRIPDTSVLASNTSTISITSMATALQRPEQFCGMHFFNPVHAMQLVEVIRGEKTSDSTVATVVDYALGLGKKPVVVNDCPGFLVNRVLFALMFGYELLVAEGGDFRQIDRAMEKWGWPMGPAYLIDVVGIDTINHCYPVMINGIPQRFKAFDGASPTGMVFAADRLGQKNNLGWYKYELNKKGRREKQVDDTIVAMMQQRFGEPGSYDNSEIVDRLMIPMANEMAHCIAEGIVASPHEADMALVYGVGFPVFRGGICRWMDEIGIDELCKRAAKYKHLGALYEPADNLVQMAANGQTWYG